jgi:seryl-tRNA synthetase
MLDVLDFITERGGNPEKIRESQRRRFANVESPPTARDDTKDQATADIGNVVCGQPSTVPRR